MVAVLGGPSDGFTNNCRAAIRIVSWSRSTFRSVSSLMAGRSRTSFSTAAIVALSIMMPSIVMDVSDVKAVPSMSSLTFGNNDDDDSDEVLEDALEWDDEDDRALDPDPPSRREPLSPPRLLPLLFL